MPHESLRAAEARINALSARGDLAALGPHLERAARALEAAALALGIRAAASGGRPAGWPRPASPQDPPRTAPTTSHLLTGATSLVAPERQARPQLRAHNLGPGRARLGWGADTSGASFAIEIVPGGSICERSGLAAALYATCPDAGGATLLVTEYLP